MSTIKKGDDTMKVLVTYFSQSGNTEKIANAIWENGTQSPKGMIIQFPLTHEDLSFLTGAHRVSVTRAMKALKAAGKIILEGKQLILT
jgi:CRP-like cAMP-binding protein